MEKKNSLHSIVRRINGYFRRRTFFRAVLIDILIVLIIVGASVLSVYFVEKALYLGTAIKTLHYSYDIDPLNFDKSPLDWVHFSLQFILTDENGNEYNPIFDFNPVINTALIFLIVVIIIQLLFFIFGGKGAKNKIRSYLKPIDDIALRAEKLSSEVASSEKLTKVISSNRGNLDSLEKAINEVDSSDDKITINDSELAGLEAAVNNMLKRLDESNKQQIRFVDDASHELRTPIAVIQGYINMLDRWGKDDEAVRDEAINAIKNESEHMKQLVEQLLFLARGSMDRLVLERKDVSISSLLNEIYDESVMIDSNHDFVKLLPESDFNINVDTGMYKQCVRVLVDNAIKYTPVGGTVTLKAYKNEKGKSCFEVSDTGVGISGSDMPYIFDRFYRSASARSKQGSGLGLSIAKWIAEKHGGSIDAVSVEGVGTKMTVII